MTYNQYDEKWMDSVIDKTHGIIRHAHFIKTDEGDPPLHWAWAEPSNSLHVFGKQTLNRGSAVSFCSRRALAKACGEAIERYCSGFYDLDGMVFDSYNNLQEIAVDPVMFPIPDSMKGNSSLKHCDLRCVQRYWAPAVSWDQQKLHLVPAEFVCVPFLPDGYKPLIDGISTGLACHSSFERAAMGAILEVIERDAFMLFWYLGEACSHLDPDSLYEPNSKKIVHHLKCAGYELHITDIAQERTCPVVLCIAYNDLPGFPRATIGLGADRNFGIAVLKALEEVSLGVIGMRKLLAKRLESHPRSFASLEDHGFWYAADPSLTANIRNKFTNSSEVSILEMMGKYGLATEDSLSADWLSSVTQVLGDIFFCDITTRDIADVGLTVVRAVAPSAQPLDISHDRRAISHSRLQNIREQKGIPEQAIFDEPHPFP